MTPTKLSTLTPKGRLRGLSAINPHTRRSYVGRDADRTARKRRADRRNETAG